jgi:hypothetical protein
MWFPVDKGMVNLERVAYIEVTGTYEIQFFNDARAKLTEASFETETELEEYLHKLKEEVDYPLTEDQTEHERFPSTTREHLLDVDSNDEE